MMANLNQRLKRLEADLPSSPTTAQTALSELVDMPIAPSAIRSFLDTRRCCKVPVVQDRNPRTPLPTAVHARMIRDLERAGIDCSRVPPPLANLA